MVERNLTLPYEFVCFTEDNTGINPNIRTESLPWNKSINGWWYKPYFFNPDFLLKGTILFLDLDLIIFKNIDNLFSYKEGSFCIIRDFNRYLIKDYQKFNSSVFRLTTGQHSNVYTNFIKEVSVTNQFHGDQDWIRHCVKSNFTFWPDSWIQSYKWEMRKRPAMTTAPKGERNFVTAGEPVIDPETSIAVFHGDPNPHNCIDPWCAKHWV